MEVGSTVVVKTAFEMYSTCKDNGSGMMVDCQTGCVYGEWRFSFVGKTAVVTMLADNVVALDVDYGANGWPITWLTEVSDDTSNRT